MKPWIAIVLYTVVVLMWLVPDRRIEKSWRAVEGERDLDNG